MNRDDATVARGAAALYAASVVTLVLNTIFLVLLTNLVPKAEVGLVSFLNVVVVSAGTLSVMALPISGAGATSAPPAVARFLTEIASGGITSARRVYFVSIGFCALVSLSVVAICSYSPVAALVAGPSQTGSVFFAGVDALAFSFASLGSYCLLGLGRATTAGKFVLISAALRYAFATGFLLAGSGVAGIFIGFALGDVAMAAYGNITAFRAVKVPQVASGRGSPYRGYMVSVFFAALMSLGITQADKLLAFFQQGLGNLAVYNIATVGASIASYVPTAVTNVLVPAFAGFKDQKEKRIEMIRLYTRHISLSAIPLGFALAAVSPFILWVFGDVYPQGAPVMAVVALSISLTSVASVYTSALLVEDKAHHFALSNLLALAGLLAVSLLTVPYYQIFGIALGRSAMAFILLISVAYFVRKTGSLVLDRAAYFKSLGASSLMALLIFGALTGVEDLGFGRAGAVLGTFVVTPVGLLVYLLVMKSLKGFNQADMDFFEGLLPSPVKGLSKVFRRFL